MLPKHTLKLVLVEPEIPQNTGNIARLCAATGAALHLVRPLGFILSDKHFKRAGMDYLSRVAMAVHDDLPALFRVIGSEPIYVTTGLEHAGAVDHWAARFVPEGWIFLGKESAGLPAEVLAREGATVIRVPMMADERGLNVSTAAGVVLYEALRQAAINSGGRG